MTLRARPRSSLLLVLGMVLSVSSTARADPIFTFGRTEITTAPPADLADPVDLPIVFFEHAEDYEFNLPVNLFAPGAAPSAGGNPCEDSVTASWPATSFVFMRPAESALPSTESDVIVFFGEVLGLATDTECMVLSSAPFEHPDVIYPASGGLDFEPGSVDAVEVFQSGRTVWHRMRSTSPDWDGYRVIVEAPAPELQADIQLACPDAIGPFEAGDATVVTYDITNPGPAAAPDVQIAFRFPIGVRIDKSTDAFICEEESVANLHICTLSGASLGPGASAQLLVNVSFDAPSAAGRATAFGSGAVHDRPLENNECYTIIRPLPGPDGGVPDGGLSDAAVPDGAVRDSAAAADTGPGGDAAGGDAAAGVSFRGAGGCACEAAGARALRGVPPSALIAFAFFAFFALVRRFRRQPRQ